jgi:predicted dehydrogenase
VARHRFGVAIVGGGYWGSKLARIFLSTEAWELRWACDVDVSRARQALCSGHGATATSSLEDVLEDPGVSAVAIATPADSHAALSMKALAAGKHVMVEKPIAMSLVEAERMVRFAKPRT